MKTLISHRYLIRKNWLAILGFCLTIYFSYHAFLGERSYLRLMTLERQISKQEMLYDGLAMQRTEIERRVTKMRPDTLDKDLLEERVHTVLGYYHPDEKVILR